MRPVVGLCTCDEAQSGCGRTPALARESKHRIRAGKQHQASVGHVERSPEIESEVLDLEPDLELASRAGGKTTRLVELLPRASEIPVPHGRTPAEEADLGPNGLVIYRDRIEKGQRPVVIGDAVEQRGRVDAKPHSVGSGRTLCSERKVARALPRRTRELGRLYGSCMSLE